MKEGLLRELYKLRKQSWDMTTALNKIIDAEEKKQKKALQDFGDGLAEEEQK